MVFPIFYTVSFIVGGMMLFNGRDFLTIAYPMGVVLLSAVGIFYNHPTEGGRG